MLIVIIRALILFTLLLIVIRLMGKRQLGEMQPFELVITLVISELACIPVADKTIPLTFGVVAMVTMFGIHQLLLLLSKNNRMQRVVSGKPVIVYDYDGIKIDNLTALNMQVVDLLQSLRATGHFSLEEITFGVMETSGQLSVISNKKKDQLQQYQQVPLIVQGRWNDNEMHDYHLNQKDVMSIVNQYKVRIQRIVLLSIDQTNRITLQIKGRKIIFDTIRGEKLLNE